jgi:2,4-diaminopentanoate dehydrogenase
MIRIIQVGVGPLGRQIVRYIVDREGLELVGVVDMDPSLHGRDAGDVCGLAPLGLPIATSLDEARLNAAESADVAVLATVSSIDRLVPQVVAAAAAGLDMVSTCEELSFPWKRHRSAAETIDTVCRKHDVACLGTGVNPG